MLKNRIHVIWIFGALITVNLAVFFPSFFHVARGGHLLLLIDIEKFDRFPDILKFLYSWNRTNVHVMGDYLLFRPIFFLLIALQKSLFGLHFTWWQITSWLLHLGVIVQLIRILMLIRVDVLAFGFALCFSVLHISQEMVIWHNVSGYLVFLILLLEALYHFVRYTTGQGPPAPYLALMLTALTLACFTCEFGVIGNMIFFGFFYILKQKGRLPQSTVDGFSVSLLLLPVGIFLSANLYDYFVATQFRPFPLQHLGITEFIYYAWDILIIAAGYGFLPFLFLISTGSHLHLETISRQTIISNYHAHPVLFLLNIILILLMALLFFLTIFRIFSKPNETKENLCSAEKAKELNRIQTVFWIAISMFASYTLALALRSIIRRYTFYYLDNLHHFYVLSLFLFIGFYCLLALSQIRNKKYQKVTFLLTLCVLSLSMLLNAVKTYQINAQLRNEGSSWRLQMDRLQDFIDLHKNERDFSYRLLWGQVNEYIENSFGPPGKEEFIRGNLSDLLFKKYTEKENPKYYLLYFEKDGLHFFTSKEKAQNYLNIRLKFEHIPIKK